MKKLLAISLISLLLINCKKDDSDTGNQPCTYDPCATVAPAAEIQAVQNYLTTNNITATQHCSGLFYKIENAGTGVAPTSCSFIIAGYVGRLTNGNIFDQSPQGQYLEIELWKLIKGWINGLPLIKAGGKIRLYIPPSLGYGAADQKDQNGAVVIPGNSVIIFEVDLVAVK